LSKRRPGGLREEDNWGVVTCSGATAHRAEQEKRKEGQEGEEKHGGGSTEMLL